LQALHHRGLLTSADIISTVSGGGYPVYGLVAAKQKRPEESLDSLLDGDGKHIERVESTTFIDNFDGVFNGALGAAGALWMLPFYLLGPTPDLVEDASVAHVYALDIADTFSGPPTFNRHGNSSLANSEELTEQLRLPYWIIQASASSGLRPPAASHKYSFEDVFELSPNWIGSDRTGYMRSFIPSLNLMQSVVASAAAIDTPRTNSDQFVVPDWAKMIGFGLGIGISLQDGKQVFLSDGGFIDNQAVIPLLRRSCKTILALDASHDPFAKMRGWSIVARYMQATGSHVVTPRFIEDGNSNRAADAWSLPSHLLSLSSVDSKQQSSQIVVMKLGISPVSVNRYPAATREFLERQIAQWGDSPRCNGAPRLAFRCMFPQQATVTQNFSAAEFRAYRCLGYFMVDEFLASSFAASLQHTPIPARSGCESGSKLTSRTH
jgi:hypothetical protein